MNYLQHPDNDHWHEWRESVKRTGYTFQLHMAAAALLALEEMTPQQFESYCAHWEKTHEASSQAA